MHDLEFLFCFLQKKEKGTEFLLCFLQINEKGMHVSEFCFSLCRKKEKGNMPREFDFSFPGRSKYDEIS